MSKILIIDDDEDICENLIIRLQVNKFETVAVHSGQDGVHAIDTEKPDLVLLDVMMPGMDGFEACKQIKDKTGTHFLPVIMLTALRSLEERIKGFKVGADDFVSKPFEDEELLARVHAFLRIKTVHDKLEESYAALKRMEALKENLTELIVHDLKSPVSTIIATLAIFQARYKTLLTEPIYELCGRIKRSCQLQLDLISDILEISRLEQKDIQLTREFIFVPGIIDECIAQVEMAALQKEVNIEKVIANNLPRLCADQNYIQRVILNLLNNSLKYTQKGGFIRIAVSCDLIASQFIFCIEDNGLGISPENLDKIFNRFFQVAQSAEGARRGVGLGLSFCHMAVEAHHGSIWAESEEGKGSRFYFKLPCS